MDQPGWHAGCTSGMTCHSRLPQSGGPLRTRNASSSPYSSLTLCHVIAVTCLLLHVVSEQVRPRSMNFIICSFIDRLLFEEEVYLSSALVALAITKLRHAILKYKSRP